MSLKPLAFAALLVVSVSSHGADLVLEAQAASGGDTLTQTLSGNSELKAGDAIHLAIGSSWPISADENTRLNTTLGYSFSSQDYSNGDASIRRFPIELSVNQWFNKLALTAGFSYHISPTIEIDAAGISADVEADNALGVFGGIAYRFESDTELGLRATRIDYEKNGGRVDANAIGLFVKLYR